MKKPICKICEKENKKYSVVEPMGGTTTLMSIQSGYWDGEGKYFPPYNPNRTTYSYRCSNGHQWEEIK
jgi:hypothetical protein